MPPDRGALTDDDPIAHAAAPDIPAGHQLLGYVFVAETVAPTAELCYHNITPAGQNPAASHTIVCRAEARLRGAST